jgi:hypothetical protein
VAQSAPRQNNAIEKIMLSSAGYVHQPSDPQIDELASVVAAALKPLLGVAMSGNVHGIRRVVELASGVAAEATMLACMHQEAANRVARERTTWPLNVSADPVERRRALRLVTGARALPLGQPEVAQPAAKKGLNFSSPANAAVLVAMKAIQIERAFRVPSELFPTLQPAWSVAAAQLPDLDATASVTERWFEVIWMYVCQRHDGAPETSALRRILPDEARAGATGAPDPAKRAALRQLLRATFERLLSAPPRRRGARRAARKGR